MKKHLISACIALFAASACLSGGGGGSGEDLFSTGGMNSGDEPSSGGTTAQNPTGGTSSGGSTQDGPPPTGSGTVPAGEPCSDTDECIPGTICFNEYCVGSGVLRISLAFYVDSDFDLYVQTPLGSVIYYGYREADGGMLDVDQCISYCSGPGPHVENVVFENNAPPGTYTVWVENYDGREGGAFTIEVAGVVNQTFDGFVSGSSRAVSTEYTFNVPGGA